MQTPTTIQEVAQLAGETNSEHYAWYSHGRNKTAEKLWMSTDFCDIKSMASTQGITLDKSQWEMLFELAVTSAIAYSMQLE